MLTDDGSAGICVAYNRFIQYARNEPACEGLILVHDDVELLDPNFREKVLAALAGDDVGIVGVIGGSQLKEPAWWSARELKGRVLESRGPISFGNPGRVEVVDGLFLAFSRKAIEQLEFDPILLPAFHGYDTDICLRAQSIGLSVVVAPIDVLHRTKGGLGDVDSWNEAQRALEGRWGSVINPEAPLERFKSVSRRAQGRLGSLRRRAVGLVRRYGAPVKRLLRGEVPRKVGALGGLQSLRAQDSEPVVVPICPACVQRLDHSPPGESGILACSTCGTGVTWPPPTLDVTSEEIFVKQYGGSRLANRKGWLEEARKRLEWAQLYRPDGVVLDIGCATGEFVEVATQEGYLAYGVESSAWAAGVARRFSPNITQGFVGDWQKGNPGILVEIATMWHVLEHVSDPRLLLGDLIEILGHDGLLVGEVPNYACCLAQLEQEQWEDASLISHWFHYTPEGLRRLLETSGFSVESLLPISKRLYVSADTWQLRRNDLSLKGVDLVNHDFIRFVARKTSVDR